MISFAMDTIIIIGGEFILLIEAFVIGFFFIPIRDPDMLLYRADRPNRR